MSNFFKTLKDQAFKAIASFIIKHSLEIIVAAGFGAAFWFGLIQELYKYLQLEVPLTILVMSNLVVGLLLYAIDRSRKPEKPKIEFHNIGGISWRLSLYKNGNFKIDELPYCSVHTAQYYEALGSYRCPNLNCESKQIYHTDINMAYSVAKSVLQGHVRGEINP